MPNDKPLAVITGATSGIGLELARTFAQNGYDLVITAEAGLDAAERELAGDGVSVHTVQADLSTYDGIEQLWNAVTALGRSVDAATLNAGVGQGEAFVKTTLADQLKMIDLNVSGTVHLAKRLLDDMAARDTGKVLITSSIASTIPGSYQVVYNASKSFLQSFAEAVADELKDTGVTVTSLMPGPTDTNFFHRAGMDDTPVGQGSKDDPAQVARQGFDALMAGDIKVVGGSPKTKVMEAGAGIVPDKLKAALHGKMSAPEKD